MMVCHSSSSLIGKDGNGDVVSPDVPQKNARDEDLLDHTIFSYLCRVDEGTTIFVKATETATVSEEKCAR